jgi:UDP-glucose:(glucosyl)LPS alpha-1,2-glucosyltransferase
MMIERNELNQNSQGGTELMMEGLAKRVPPELLEQVQIIPSRVRQLSTDKHRIYWLHDLPNDPESKHLENNGWDKFDKLVFVSNWQMQIYMGAYNIPPSKCVVLQNAVVPIPEHKKPTDKIRLIYFSTPHRGLDILVPVFQKLSEEFDNIELDVYSSFKLYGWEQRDVEFEALFEQCRQHPKINYHGSVSNEEIREALTKSHILAYPSTWPETSCLVLLESMSAGLLCAHPNFAGLSETGANWTNMYQTHEDKNAHANIFYGVLKSSIENINADSTQLHLRGQKSYTDLFYNWDFRAAQWTSFLEGILQTPKVCEQQANFFSYRT